MPHQKNIFCMTLKIMSKALKHVIMPWHMSSTWPIYDLNVVFKYRYWAFPFVFVFICYAFCFAYGRKGICTCINIHWYLTSLIREDLLYQLMPWILQNNLTQTLKRKPGNLASILLLLAHPYFVLMSLYRQNRKLCAEREKSSHLFLHSSKPFGQVETE